MSTNNNVPNGLKEKAAEEWVIKETSWVSDGLWLCEALDCKRAFLAGYRAALEWVMERGADIERMDEIVWPYLCGAIERELEK